MAAITSRRRLAPCVPFWEVVLPGVTVTQAPESRVTIAFGSEIPFDSICFGLLCSRSRTANMDLTNRILVGIAIALAIPAPSLGQAWESQMTEASLSAESQVTLVRQLPLEHQAKRLRLAGPQVTSPLQFLLDFRQSGIKFRLPALMNTLRDTRHEGWVLAAYPDPKTRRPLIGAGFSLDVPMREHPQRDPLNPNFFIEPSSAELWQAAGLEPQRLLTILEQYDRNLSTWNVKKFRRKIRTHSLPSEITEDEATSLLRVSAMQAIHNARAYCRNFEQLTGSQQMALTHLVFQMGVNLEQFTQFLAAINNEPLLPAVSSGTGNSPLQSASFVANGEAARASLPSSEYWDNVQDALIHSDWARRYSTRAVSVIAMFDPDYEIAPGQAEAKVRAEVHPLVLHRHRRHGVNVRTASVRHRPPPLKRSDKS